LVVNNETHMQVNTKDWNVIFFNIDYDDQDCGHEILKYLLVDLI